MLWPIAVTKGARAIPRPTHERILRQLFRLPPGYSKFLGDTVAQWALVEHLLSHGLYALLRLSPREGRIAVGEPRAADRISYDSTARGVAQDRAPG